MTSLPTGTKHYPSSKFPPPDNYKNAKIDIESNQVVPRHDFMHDMHYVQELVNMFEHLFESLEVQLVWFIKKQGVVIVFRAGTKIL